MMSAVSTFISVLTSAGRGAVAVVAVEGPSAVELVDRYFRPKSGRRFIHREINRIVYGRWGTEPAEDVIACPRGPADVEVHCHGGVAAVRRIISDLVAAGAVEQPWTTWIERQEGSPIRTAARIALSKAITERAAFVLLDQYHGALENALRSIANHLENRRPTDATSTIDKLLARASVGLHLTKPWQVVLAGPPNVGKSSLINALLGYQRAIVFDQPGTTRDVVTAQTALDGWPVELSDTAGLRATDDPLETAGVQRATAQAAAADCLVLVFDASQPWTAENGRLMEAWPAAIVVHNKCDLATPAVPGLPTSALTGAGVEPLMRAIVDRLIPFELQPGDAVPFTAEQIEALKAAAAAIRSGDVDSAKTALAMLSPSRSHQSPQQ